MPRHVAVDVETAQSCDHVIEIALVEIVDGSVTGREFVSRFKPTSAMSFHCQKVHGIKLRDLEHEPAFGSRIDEIIAFVGDAILVAHNKSTEERTLAKEMARLGLQPWPADRFVCTMRMAKEAGHPKGLREACKAAGIPTGHLGEKHAALEDTRLCAELFMLLTREGAPLLEPAAKPAALAPAAPAPGTVSVPPGEPRTPYVDETVAADGAATVQGTGPGASLAQEPVSWPPVPAMGDAADEVMPEEAPATPPAGPVSINLVSIPCYGLAIQRGNVPLVHALAVENASEDDLVGVSVLVATEPPVTRPFRVECDLIAARTTLDVPCRLLPFPQVLEAAEESLPAVLSCTLLKGETVIAEVSRPFRVLARDEWPGTATSPELLAAFVRPNEKSVDGLLRAASLRLKGAGRDPSLDGYRDGNRARAWELAEALYLALSDLGLSYALPPASFERRGQKVRSPSAVVGDRIATCLDTTLLFASCVEQAGLRPVLVLVHGHALCGVWLAPETFGQCLVDEAGALRRRMAMGDLILVETTFLAQRAPFAAAVRSGSDRMLSPETFELAIDVATARAEGMFPLELGLSGAAPDIEHPLPEPVSFGEIPALDAADGEMPPDDRDRFSTWKRKLLDLSQRNRLLNYRDGRGSVPLLVGDLTKLEDALAGGEEIGLRHRAPTTVPADRPDLLRELLGAELEQHGTVQAALEPAEFERRLTEAERSGRLSLAEGGANTLFVALGFLNYVHGNTPGGRVSRAPLLLLPVELSGVGAKRRPRIRILSEEVRFNLTLTEMLRQDFRINLAGVLPKDSAGIDVANVFARVSAAVAHMDGWAVDDRSAVLTTFSFTKFLMWKDLEERTDEIRESDAARLLLDAFAHGEGGVAGSVDVPAREYAPDSVSPADLYLPLPADASQVAAVMAAHAGESYVMIGPPGTGKSQTIANIIANSLAHGRTVLFVSQKTAALQAVSRRLDDVGMGAYCLEVHSTRAGRSDVLGQMMETWRAAVAGDASAHAKAAEDVRATRDRLNDYVGDLHAMNPNGLTARGAISLSVRARLSGMPPELDFSRLGDDHAEWLAQARSACREIEDMLVAFPSPGEHPLADVAATEWTPAMASAVVAGARALGRLADELRTMTEGFREAFGFDVGQARESLGTAAALRAHLDRPEAFAGRVYLTGRPTLRTALSQAAGLAREAETRRRELGVPYAKGAFGLDLDGLAARWDESASRNVLSKALSRRAIRKALAPYATPAPSQDTGADLRTLIEIRRLRAEAGRLLADGAVPKAFLKDGLVNVAAEERARTWAKAVAADLKAVAPANAREMASALGDARLGPALAGIGAAYEAYVPVEAKLNALVSAAPLDGDGWLARCATRAEGWAAASPRLQAWCCWREAEATARRLGIGPLVDAILAGNLPVNGVSEAFESAYAVWYAERLVGTRPLLRSFVRARHEALIERFREADERLMVESRVAVTAILGARVPDTQALGGRREWLDFQAQAASRQRSAWPLRQVFERSPEPLRALAPCMMMSPLSVAQYMPVASRFDVVIFDEASQVTPWDALGALARGKQAIVVGDPKQLPPTDSMFGADAEGADDADAASPESVLDACAEAGMKRRHLRWHYRSRHESLIAFSKAYYYPEMLAFPSPVTRDDAVRVHFVEGATYDKAARVNEAEARALVADVVRRLTDPDFVARGASLGIVTFNGPQMVLIEELLLDERRRVPEIEPFFDAARSEHVFVKNLENVQGDERDVILFSITFCRQPGRGPLSVVSNLNKSGGERRLNVAITRARDEMVLFTALRAADVAPSAATGVVHFKAFLDFAERGPQALAQAARSEGKVESVLEAEILKGLRDRGWEIHPQVGVSGYRIDLGVVNPLDRSRYLAGVECDGMTYHRAASARDRDKLRQAVLERLGWRIRRVWSTDWWHDPKGCLEELHAALMADVEEARAAMPEVPGMPEVDDGEQPADARRGAYAGQAGSVMPVGELPVDDAAPLPPLDQARFFEPSYRPILRRHAAAIIEAEWPIFQDEVVARVVALHGYRRMTREMAEAVLPVIERRFVRTKDGEGILRWLGRDHVRDVCPWRETDARKSYAEIPMPLLAGLAVRTLAGADEGQALRLMADALGIDRISGAARERLQSALDVARRHLAEAKAAAA